MSDYINISDIKINKFDDSFFQVQANKDKVVIMEVGKGGIHKNPKVLINSFDFCGYTCQLISCLHRKEYVMNNDNIELIQLKILKKIKMKNMI